MEAADAIKEMYSLEVLKEIANHGCISGCASHHIYYQDTSEFYDSYEEDILRYLELVHGEKPLKLFATCCDTIGELKNRLCWNFVDLVAHNLVLLADTCMGEDY